MNKNEKCPRRCGLSASRRSAQMEAVREEERKRIAREVHDELGQTLAALRLELSTLKRDLTRKQPESVTRVQSMVSLVDRAMKTARHVISSLRPPVLDLGVKAALAALAGDFSSHTGIAARLNWSGDDIALDERRAVAVFRIAQEALTNIGRHAQANTASISVQASSDRLLIEIADDGVGFQAGGSRGRSFGLAGIRERVLMLDGTVAIESKPGAGTRIRVGIPLPSALRRDIDPRFVKASKAS